MLRSEANSSLAMGDRSFSCRTNRLRLCSHAWCISDIVLCSSEMRVDSSSNIERRNWDQRHFLLLETMDHVLLQCSTPHFADPLLLDRQLRGLGLE